MPRELPQHPLDLAAHQAAAGIRPAPETNPTIRCGPRLQILQAPQGIHADAVSSSGAFRMTAFLLMRISRVLSIAISGLLLMRSADRHLPTAIQGAAGRPGASSSSLTAAARARENASGSRGSTDPPPSASIGTSTPVSPGTTISGIPPTRDATTGVSHAIASRLMIPNGSYT